MILLALFLALFYLNAFSCVLHFFLGSWRDAAVNGAAAAVLFVAALATL